MSRITNEKRKREKEKLLAIIARGQNLVIEDPSTSTIKVPRVCIPEDYASKLEPNFTMPPHLNRALIRAKPKLTKYKKGLQFS